MKASWDTLFKLIRKYHYLDYLIRKEGYKSTLEYVTLLKHQLNADILIKSILYVLEGGCR